VTGAASVVGAVRPALVAAASLVLGFAVAQATEVRALGGLVLVAGAAWCAIRWRARAGTAVAVALVAAYVAGFVLAHVLADPLGAWPSVLLVAAVVGGLAHAVAGERVTPAGGRGPRRRRG
jgi:membrane-bound ClpP family serine protease